MDNHQALPFFAALSQATRLQIVRMLVVAGPAGMAAGAISEKLAVSPSTLSFHLKELDRAGLIHQARDARSIIYRADYQALAALARFLMEDCCAGPSQVVSPPAVPDAGRSRGKEELGSW